VSVLTIVMLLTWVESQSTDGLLELSLQCGSDLHFCSTATVLLFGGERMCKRGGVRICADVSKMAKSICLVDHKPQKLLAALRQIICEYAP